MANGLYNKGKDNMGKYYPLGLHLRRSQRLMETLTYDQIISIIRDQLPPSASEHREWWANDNTHVQAREWLNAGWKVDNCILGESITFIKVN